MSYLYVYFIFALTTGLSATYELFWPIVKQAKKEGVVNEFTKSPYLCFSVFTILQTLIAPIIAIIVFVPPLYEAAYAGIHREVMRENPDLK